MKNQKIALSFSGLEALQTRFGLRVAARLNESSRELPHDISERLKASRELALEKARLAHRAEAPSTQTVGNGSSAAMTLGGGSGSEWLFKLASALPIIALVAGFFFIQHASTRQQIAAAAEIDAALLVDDVPPTAYSDPGFVEFLKAPRN